ncbi:phosphodiester glycosidase family protein [Streptomyces sp. NBC_01601]|uniref:phosphodiester glycosidase family protein n=1 Tax=Streptomyces sp. NBC_01601 TaxID=2975892 RepID=UPI002E2DF3F1|nr:phosphodiester glycosidase family protein [Streptomyces sp. NBC_01601]
MASVRRPWATGGVVALALTLAGCTAPAAVSPARSAPASSAASGPAAPGPAEPDPAPTGLPAGFGFRQFTRSLGPGAPVRLTVLSVAADAHVRVTGVHGADLTRADTVRTLADRSGALAAINGTYFDIRTGHHHSGYEGDPIGLYAEHGRVLSEAVDGRPALLLGHTGGRLEARVAEVATRGRLRAADGAVRELDGVNRVPGRILGCGGTGGDRLATTGRLQEKPFEGLCTDPDEVVSFAPEWGGDTPPGTAGSTEALLSADRTVLRLRTPAGGPLPEGGSSLYGIGTGAAWLRAHAVPGTRMAVSERITDPAGLPLPGPVVTAVGGSARLLRAGAFDPAAATLLGPRREPRTVAAVTADGTLLLIAVDGRARHESVGATPAEAARLALSLGAVDAVNLDGGGSTSAVLQGRLRNSPRDTEDGPVRERPVADGLVVLPGGPSG